VAEELENAQVDEPRIAAVLSLDWVAIRTAQNVLLISELRNERLLDRGESEAIALALELKAE
jgi:predicted nucleic acid-binding protein